MTAKNPPKSSSQNPIRAGVDNYLNFLAAQPAPEAENSIPLRVLVQLLVFVGIAATDVAAGVNNSAWSIPLSAIGALWAWHARNKRNVAVKFCIAIAMIAMLVVFLQSLVSQSEETRLLLAGLLIQLQVLHSFDLPRRKDLGYSIVIGVILIGVAGTLSQTMIFGFWLLFFLAIALPILVLDHRSRLGISAKEFKLEKLGIAPLPLFSLFTLILLLGLAIFAFLPRFNGLQLRNFPVSVNLNVQRQIPPGTIINPGRNNGQAQNNGKNGTGGQGNGIEKGKKGTLPPLFAEEIDSTKAFELKPELVMRVRSQAELFWRVISYDQYTGKGWKLSAGSKKGIQTLKRQPFNYEFFVPPRAGNQIFGSQAQEIVQTFTITTANFPNLIPAAANPYRVFFPSEELDLDPEGGLRSPGPLPEDMTYTVISSVMQRDRTALGKASRQYSARFAEKYLSLPAKLAPQLQIQAIALLAEAKNVATGKPLDLDNNYEKALYLTQALKQNYRLQKFNFQTSSGDLVSQFLAQRGGQPTHFVSTLAIMLRAIGIPTRYTVGFAPGKFNAFTGLYEVYNTDTISLVEVFFPGYGWFAFNPVPGFSLFPPSIESDRTFSVLQQFWNWLASFLPSPITGFFQALFNQVGLWLSLGMAWLINTLVGWGWVGFILGTVILFGIALALWGIWQLWLWQWQRRGWRSLHPVQKTYQTMVRQLEEKGFPKSAAQTPQEYAELVTRLVNAKQAAAIWALTQIYQDWNYGDRPIKASELKRLLSNLRARG